MATLAAQIQHLDGGIKRGRWCNRFARAADRGIHHDLNHHGDWTPWNSYLLFKFDDQESACVDKCAARTSTAPAEDASFFLHGDLIDDRMNASSSSEDDVWTVKSNARFPNPGRYDWGTTMASNAGYVEEGQTTLVVRNVPKHYTLEALLQKWVVDGSYDLLYYPYNLKSKRRLGFCFINFVSDQLALEFQQKWHGREFPDHHGALPLDITMANLQGFTATLERFRGKRIELMGDVEYLPAIFRGRERIDVRDVLVDLGLIEVTGPFQL